MFNKILKISFAIVGAVTGYTLAHTFFTIWQGIILEYQFQLVIQFALSFFTAFLFYSTGNYFFDRLLSGLDRMEKLIQNMTLYEITISVVGLIAGLVVANLVTIPLNKLSVVGIPLSITANIIFGAIGVYIAAGKRNDDIWDFFKDKGGLSRKLKVSAAKIVDTSVLIDGRIVDILKSGFLDGELIVPGFILDELRHIADSQDILKRNRGRRGLDILNIIQKELEYPVRIENIDINEGAEVDGELLKAAKKFKAKVLTIDYNLNKVAGVQNIPVLNINELANAVKPIALPGEELDVQVIKDGKENGQGIGYMDDGTMIVVENGRSHIGETVTVMVTSVLQTAAGRMIFAKPKFIT